MSSWAVYRFVLQIRTAPETIQNAPFHHGLVCDIINIYIKAFGVGARLFKVSGNKRTYNLLQIWGTPCVGIASIKMEGSIFFLLHWNRISQVLFQLIAHTKIIKPAQFFPVSSYPSSQTQKFILLMGRQMKFAMQGLESLQLSIADKYNETEKQYIERFTKSYRCKYMQSKIQF